MINRKPFSIRDLVIVSPAPPPTLHHPGSLVRLNSGGPIGIVQSSDAEDMVTVRWLTGDRQQSVLPTVCVTSAVLA